MATEGASLIWRTRADLAADDLTSVVDAKGQGCRGAGDVDGGEDTSVREKTLARVQDIASSAHGLRLRGTPSRVCGRRWSPAHQDGPLGGFPKP
jgi:hypothetical protein